MRQKKKISKYGWKRLDSSLLPLRFTVAESVLTEFVLSHDPSAVLTELVQNEYDANGSRLELSFDEEFVRITGNGNPIDHAGWRRLSVMLGTGNVLGLGQQIKPKTNSIGSKNFGLRALLNYGDQIYIRSGGKQTILDLYEGTLPEPRKERRSRDLPGIHIEVPYRVNTKGSMEAFDVKKEEQVLNRFSKDLMPTLIKLAHPNALKTLREVEVTSVRCRRRITWQQFVSVTPSFCKNVKVFHRSTIMKDIQRTNMASRIVHKLEELEFQKSYRIPEQYRKLNLPNYYRTGGGRIMLSVSLRIKKGTINLLDPGIFYYPLGLPDEHTGTNVSVSAPFQLDNDRSRIIDPENSQWNKWLLETASDLTAELLVSDWFKRFGATAYLSLRKNTTPSVAIYSDLLDEKLRNEDCWPTREINRNKVRFSRADKIVVAANDNLEGFLSDDRYLNNELAIRSEIQDMVLEYGSKLFTLNSLVRLRCYGSDNAGMRTELQKKEADYHYPQFPSVIMEQSRQVKFARAIDNERRGLSDKNREDLRHTETTLTSEGNLRAPSQPLWVADVAIEKIVPVPKDHLLHPTLSMFKTIAELCRRFDGAEWALGVVQRIQIGVAADEEQIALYRYILSNHGKFGRKTQAILRKAPVLLDHRGEWVEPRQITDSHSSIVKRLDAVLHFPNNDYSKDQELAKAFRFKQKVVGNDLIEYAKVVQQHSELAAEFEGILQKVSYLLTRKVSKVLSQIAFLRNTREGLSAPSEIYLRTPINNICLGRSANFALGSKESLYKRLLCPTKPRSEDIYSHLMALRDINQKPEKIDILYTILEAALRAERKPTDYYAKEPIIWNGGNYSCPEDTILGQREKKLFIGAVPCINVTSSILKQAFRSLGVATQPNEIHWGQLLMWIGEQYQDSTSPVPNNVRQSLRYAYKNLKAIPEGLPNYAMCFLCRKGILFSLKDITNGRLLIDDDPQMSQSIEGQDVTISFVDTSEPGLLKFYSEMGMKSLTEVRKEVETSTGELCPPPTWFKASNIISKIHSPEFSSAVMALSEHEFIGYFDLFDPASERLTSKLQAVTIISFATKLIKKYIIANHTLEIPVNYILGDDSIVLKRTKSRSDLYGILSYVIAKFMTNKLYYQRRLADAIFRLLTCRTVLEMKNYLNDRGIPWSPPLTSLEDWEEIDEDEDTQDEDEIRDIIADLFNKPVSNEGGSVDSGEVTGDIKVDPPKEPANEPKPVPRALPPFDNIVVNNYEPTESWHPPEPSGGGRGRIHDWSPPTPSDDEWERAIGRRGEEIIYKSELERAKKLGYDESRVIWVADKDPSSDFDIQSVDDDGNNLYLEVKSTTGKDGRFHWPKTEFEKAISKRNRYILWRVYEADSLSPSIKPFRDPIGILLRQGMRLDINRFYAVVEPLGVQND